MLDAKVTLDDDAAFRHPEWAEFDDLGDVDERERLAKEKGLQYIGLDGSVGIIANGAGLAMSTLDVVNQVGGDGRQLPRHRRRRQRRRDGERARGDQHRPESPGDPRQHLRRDRPLRRGRPGDPGRARAGRHLVADRPPPRRHERRPRRGAILADRASEQIVSEPTMLERRPAGGRARGRASLCGRFGLVSIFVDETTRSSSRDSPASQGRFHGLRNRAYGTKVVAGVTPGKGGQDVEGIPVFDSVAEAVDAHRRATPASSRCRLVRHRRPSSRPPRPASASSCASPSTSRPRTRRSCNARLVRDFPGTRLLGPNCPGHHLAREVQHRHHRPATSPCPGGPVGIVSRSGTLTYQALHELSQQGIGQTTCVGIGGDPVPGTTFVDVSRRLPGGPRDPGGDDDRRDRRRGRGAGGGLHRRRDGQAGRRLHRRRDRPGGPQDGSRRRHRLRLAAAPPRPRWRLCPPPACSSRRTRPKPAS